MALKPIFVASKEVILPLSRKTISVRPYTAANEKQLLLVDRKNHKEMSKAMVDLLTACVTTDGFGRKEVGDLPASDAMYLYMYLHAMSVGTEKKAKFRCGAPVDNPAFADWEHANPQLPLPLGTPPEKTIPCPHEQNVTIDIAGIDLPDDEYPLFVTMSDGTRIDLMLPTIGQQMDLDARRKDDPAYAFGKSIEMMAACMVTITQGGEVTVVKDEDPAGVRKWIEDLHHMNFETLTKWFEQIPKPSMTVEWACSECGNEHKVPLELGEHFFH